MGRILRPARLGALAGLVNFAGITLRDALSENVHVRVGTRHRHQSHGKFSGDPHLGIPFPGRFLDRQYLIVGRADRYFGAAYSSSKWAIRGSTRSAAMEFSSRGIRVNAVCPGLVDSPMPGSENSSYGSEQAESFYAECEVDVLNGRVANLDKVAPALNSFSARVRATSTPAICRSMRRWSTPLLTPMWVAPRAHWHRIASALAPVNEIFSTGQ